MPKKTEPEKWESGLEARCSLCSSTDVEKKTVTGNSLAGVTIVGECRSCGREFWLQAGPPENRNG